MSHILNKERRVCYNTHPRIRHDNYSRNRKDPNFFAPAVIQRFASSMMVLSRVGGGLLLCRNTLAFLSFQMTHDTSMVIEAFAFRLVVPTTLVLAHHVLTESKELHADVSMSCMRNF